MNGFYNADDRYELRCSYFTFAPLIDSTLDKIFDEWNGHKMRPSSKNPGGVPDFLYLHPEQYNAEQCGLAVPPLLTEFVHATFSGSVIDLDDLFQKKRDHPVFSTALSAVGLYPPIRENMTEAFLYLRTQREIISPLLDD